MEVCQRKYAVMARYCGLATEKTDNQEAAELFLKAIDDLIITCGLDKLESPVQASDHEELIRMIAADSINYSAPLTFSKKDIEQVLTSITPNE